MEFQEFSAAVVPCLNEAISIGAIVRAVQPHVREVWVIDDGSSDSTTKEVELSGARVIRHAVNLGKGASLRDGFRAAHAAGFKFVVTLDGDGQHDCAEIPKLLKAATDGADLVIGDRASDHDGMTLVRRCVNWWMSRQMSRKLGIECPDSQCGFRVVRLEAWAGLTLRQNRFEVESEMLTAFARAGKKIAWVPVRCLPAKRPSRIHPVRDTLRWFRWWWFASK